MRGWKICIPVLLLVAAALSAGETPVKSRIVSVGLFKNGLAVVRREVALPGAGTFLLDDVPEAVHGTWFVQSDVPLETQVTEREVSRPMRRDSDLDFQSALEGKTVTIHFREGQIPPATGKVEAVARGDATWGRTYQQPSYSGYWNPYSSASTPAPHGRFLVLQTETGRIFVDSGLIAYLKCEGKDETFKQRAPVLLLTTTKPIDKPSTAIITYLARGMAWSPSYRVDISDPKTLVIEQAAVIRNELDDLDGADVQLISGFPSVQFGHVVSPLSPRTTWVNFFQQLNQRFSSGHDLNSNIAQQAVAYNEPAPGGLDLSAKPVGEGVDLHYQPIGARILKAGDSMALSIATEKAPYERIVEWIVPDTRDEYGRYVQEYQRQQNPDKYQDAAWDAVRFRNPFAFPMTTAAAMVVANGRFNGQRMSYWVNAGEETSLQVTKALSLRTHSVEHEEQGQREIVWIGGHDFRKTTVKGELTVNNHRKEEIKLVVRRQFSGELLVADADPKKTLREEGVYSVNPRNELIWSLTLKPGEEKVLTYRYSVLVYN